MESETMSQLLSMVETRLPDPNEHTGENGRIQVHPTDFDYERSLKK